MSSVEIIGGAFTIVVLLVLLHLGKRRKHGKSYPMCVVLWCRRTGNQFVTPVRSVDCAQVYVNTLNITNVSNPHITKDGEVTHVLEDGVWSPVSL